MITVGQGGTGAVVVTTVVVVAAVAIVVAVAANFFSSGCLVELKVRLELDFCDESGVTPDTNERSGCGV